MNKSGAANGEWQEATEWCQIVVIWNRTVFQARFLLKPVLDDFCVGRGIDDRSSSGSDDQEATSFGIDGRRLLPVLGGELLAGFWFLQTSFSNYGLMSTP